MQNTKGSITCGILWRVCKSWGKPRCSNYCERESSFKPILKLLCGITLQHMFCLWYTRKPSFPVWKSSFVCMRSILMSLSLLQCSIENDINKLYEVRYIMYIKISLNPEIKLFCHFFFTLMFPLVLTVFFCLSLYEAWT